MAPEEPQTEPHCALNLRRFPKELRKRLRKIAIDLDEDIQDFAPKWLRRRLEEEEAKLKSASKKGSKPKIT
jgi:hypothetical protein